MNRKLITGVVAGSALSSVLALSACGSSTDAKPVAKTTPSVSATAHTMSASSAARGGVVDGKMLATMVADAMVASKTAHMALATNGKPGGEGDYKFGNPVSVDMKMSQQGMDLEIVQTDGAVYVKGIPGLPKPWLKVNPQGTDAFSKAMSSMGDLSKSSDPRAAISMMNGVKGRDLGTARVGGVATRHFAFKIKLSAYGKLLSPQMLKAAKGTIKDPIATDYWLGDDNLPRKVTSVVTLKGGKKQSTQITYSDWGKPVNIVAPPAAQVATPPSR